MVLFCLALLILSSPSFHFHNLSYFHLLFLYALFLGNKTKPDLRLGNQVKCFFFAFSEASQPSNLLLWLCILFLVARSFTSAFIRIVWTGKGWRKIQRNKSCTCAVHAETLLQRQHSEKVVESSRSKDPKMALHPTLFMLTVGCTLLVIPLNVGNWEKQNACKIKCEIIERDLRKITPFIIKP